MAFFIWFSISPLLNDVAESLDLNRQQIWTSNICSVSGTIVMRFVNGPLSDKYGARILMGVVLMLASIPAALTGLVSSATGLNFLRFFIGLVGSTFVMSQVWVSRMFTNEVAGTAQALVGGWGNLGGGVTQIVMGSVLFPLFKAFGMTPNLAWRIVCVFPAIAAFATGVIIMKISDDCPRGNYCDLKEKGIISDVSLKHSFGKCLRNHNTWILFIQYGCCFGVELTMNNAAAKYFQDVFLLRTESAAAIASIFGWMNLFARGIGGFISDKFNSKMGMRGRLIWQSFSLIIEGVMIILFSYTNNLVHSILILAVFSTFVQAAEGSTYGIVPYIDPESTGAISGIVGAGGNTLAVVFAVFFHQLDDQTAFYIMGISIFVSSALSAFVCIDGHRALFCGKDSPSTESSWKSKGIVLPSTAEVNELDVTRCNVFLPTL